VYTMQTVCDEAGVEHPNIISESGRAISAFHSVLVFGVLGVSQQGSEETTDASLAPPDDAEQVLHDLYQSYRGLTQRNALETFHDAQTTVDTVMTLFNTGYLSLEQRCLAENLYFATCYRIWQLTGAMEFVPEELERLDKLLSDNYFCNFSLYQEILGDLHNLFGDTNAVHVDISETGDVILDTIIKGETVSEVLDYVQFRGRDLINRLQVAVEVAVRENRIDNSQAGQFVKFYEEALNGYTYLEEPDGE
jgi:arginine decarboxylase-like protein